MPKGQTLESMKLTKKQLQTEYCHGNLDATIGTLTVDQLRIALYVMLREEKRMNKALTKVSAALREIIP